MYIQDECDIYVDTYSLSPQKPGKCSYSIFSFELLQSPLMMLMGYHVASQALQILVFISKKPPAYICYLCLWNIVNSVLVMPHLGHVDSLTTFQAGNKRTI